MAEKKAGAFSKIAKYFKDVKAEFKKVIWPTLKQTANNTVVVIAVVVIFAVVVGLLDYFFSWGFNWLVSK